MSRLPRLTGIISVVVGVLAIVAGVVTWVIVRDTLTDQHITVASDASFLAGHEVTGPLTAYAQAMVLNDHALEAGGGKTYAQLDRSDPTRTTVMTANFLQTSLYTSVVAFGVAFLVAALGVMFILLGLSFRELDKRSRVVAEPVLSEGP